MSARIVLTFAVILISAGMVFGGVELMLRSQTRSRWAIASGLLAASIVFLLLQPGSWILSNLVLFLASTVLGFGISWLLPSVPSVWTFLLVASVADAVSYGWGFTASTIESYASGSSELLRFLSISIPSGARLQPIVGVGDLVILASLFSALHRLKIRRIAAFGFPTAGLIVAAALGLAVGGVFAVPFIAASTAILLIYRRRALRRAGFGRTDPDS